MEELHKVALLIGCAVDKARCSPTSSSYIVRAAVSVLLTVGQGLPAHVEGTPVARCEEVEELVVSWRELCQYYSTIISISSLRFGLDWTCDRATLKNNKLRFHTCHSNLKVLMGQAASGRFYGSELLLRGGGGKERDSSEIT